jgi:hypothetical protein
MTPLRDLAGLALAALIGAALALALVVAIAAAA